MKGEDAQRDKQQPKDVQTDKGEQEEQKENQTDKDVQEEEHKEMQKEAQPEKEVQGAEEQKLEQKEKQEMQTDMEEQKEEQKEVQGSVAARDDAPDGSNEKQEVGPLPPSLTSLPVHSTTREFSHIFSLSLCRNLKTHQDQRLLPQTVLHRCRPTTPASPWVSHTGATVDTSLCQCTPV